MSDTLEFRRQLLLFMLNPDSKTNQDSLVLAALRIQNESIRKAGNEPDKYMEIQCRMLEDVVQGIKISERRGKLLDKFMRELSGEEGSQRQAFHPLNLVYNFYLKNNIVSEDEENLHLALLVLKKLAATQQKKIKHIF